MARRSGGGALVSQLGRRCEPARMINQRIPKRDPKLRITGIARDGVLKNADRVFALAVARQCFGHSKPGFGGREVTEKGVTRIGQWENVASFIASCG